MNTTHINLQNAFVTLTFLFSSLIVSSSLLAKPELPYTIKRTDSRMTVDHKLFRLYFIFRNPEQIGAFYYARGFPPAMVKKLQKVCFMTVGMHNKSKDIIWLDIRQWKFNDKQGPLTRYNRAYWFSEWKKMNIPLRFQSTFRWTLIPTRLDYRAGEREGGNITIDKRGQAFTVTALVRPGKKPDSPPIKVIINNVKCANNTNSDTSSKRVKQ